MITPDLLLRGYAMGIFPMAESREDPEIHWVDPRRRGVLPIGGFRTSHSLAKRIRGCGWAVTVDRDFAGVVEGCADRAETWISAPIRALYLELHQRGVGHSLELWEGDALVGGVYGVQLGAAFFGESMFSRRRDASKVALAHLMHRLQAGGFTLCDTQFLTAHLASLGGVEISRAEYQRQLAQAVQRQAAFSPAGYCPLVSPSGTGASGSSAGASGTSGITPTPLGSTQFSTQTS